MIFFLVSCFICFTSVCVLLACFPVHHVYRACGDQKRAVDSLGVALKMIVSGHVGAGNGTWVL